MDAPCGFPIVTEKRSSSKISISTSAQQNHHHAGSKPPPSSMINFKVPIRECDILGLPAGTNSDNACPIVFTALETNVTQNITALMTIRYYDEVQRECTRIRGSDPPPPQEGLQGLHENRISNSQEQMSIATTTTTVAHVSIHISMTSGSFHSSNHSYNAETDVQFHRIVLSATTSTKEININSNVDSETASTSTASSTATATAYAKTQNMGPDTNKQCDWEVLANLTHSPRLLYHEYTFSDVVPQLVVSSNGKYLACIIPRPIRKKEHMPKDENTSKSTLNAASGPALPRSGSINMVSIKPAGISSLVIFNLEPPTVNDKGDDHGNGNGDAVNAAMEELPLPKYLQLDESYNDEQQGQYHSMQGRKDANETAPIPTNPQILSLCHMSTSVSKNLANLLSQITCLVDFDHGKTTSATLLLAGCTDGSMLVVVYKRAIALGIGFQSQGYCSSGSGIDAGDGNSAHSRRSGDPSNSILLKKFGWDGRSTGLQALKFEMKGASGQSPDKGPFQGRLLGIQRDGRMVMFATGFREATNGNAFNSEQRPAGLIQTMAWKRKKYSFQMTVEPMRGLSGNSVTSYTNGTFIDFDTIAVLARPLQFYGQERDLKFDDKICQVWCIDTAHSGVKMLAVLSLDHVKLEGMQHGSYSLPLDKNNTGADSKCPSAMQQQTFIDYDRVSGCLSISSAIPLCRSPRSGGVDAKMFALLWDWRTCTIGFTLACRQSIRYSYPNYEFHSKKSILTPNACSVSQQRLYRQGGETKIIHLFGHQECYSNVQYTVGVLSPARCRRSSRGFEDQNPILLSKNYVMYPDLLQPSVNKDIQVEWKHSKLPLSYITKYGPVASAALGNRFGRSLAVIGSRGLCVLDINRGDVTHHSLSKNVTSPSYATACVEGFECQFDKFQYNQFKSTKDHWRMFKRMDEQSFTVKAIVWWEEFNNTKEDIIIAVIEYMDKKDPRNHLVAWSSNRLEMREYQLIVDIDNRPKVIDTGSTGLCLPNNCIPTEMSILIREEAHQRDRAVLSITGDRNGLAYNSVIQLQVTPGDGNDTIDRILAHKYSETELPSLLSLSDHCFLASCSFQFDLEYSLGRNNCPVILGVLQDHGLSLSALKVDSTGTTQKATIANLWKKSANSHRITKVWKNDFAPSTIQIQGDGNQDTSAWTWSFLKANGGIFSWCLGDNTIFEVTGNESSVALHRSVRGHLQEVISPPISNHSFGIKSDDSKTLKGSISDESTILLGPLPCTEHRHLLYSGQKIRSRRGLDNSSASTSELYGASDFDIGIPSSTGGILLNLSLIVEFQQTGNEQIAEDLLLQMCYYIQRLHNSETTFAGLRAIISFLTELVSKKEERSPDNEAERKKVLKAIQSALARITISALVQVQFISLFLNVGRQLEPHHFKSLFPLSLSSSIKDTSQVLTLRDLFDMAVEDGSFSVPSAALPLFSNKKEVHSLCINLLHHCIDQVFNLIDSNSVDVKCLREECRSLQQLYSYILKVEDSERVLQHSTLEDDASVSLSSQSSHDSLEYDSERSVEYKSADEEFSLVDSPRRSSYENHVSEQTLTPPGRISRITSKFIKTFTARQRQNENAISEAATSFIHTYKYNAACSIRSVDSVSSNVSLSDSSSIISSEDELNITAYFENEDRAAFCGSGIIGMSIVSTTFFVEDISPEIISHGLRNVAALCMLLCNENDPMTRSSHHLVAELSDQDFMFSMQMLENMHAGKGYQARTNSLETSSTAAIFMELLLVQSSKEWNEETANAVVEMTSSILSENENRPEISLLSPFLLMLLVTACHVAKKGHIFADGDSILASIYCSVLDGINNE